MSGLAGFDSVTFLIVKLFKLSKCYCVHIVMIDSFPILDGLRRLLCELTLNPIPPRGESLLNQLFRSDTDLWKGTLPLSNLLLLMRLLRPSFFNRKFIS